MKMKTNFLLEAESAKSQGYYNRAVIALATAFHIDKKESVSPKDFFTTDQLEAIKEIYIGWKEKAETLLSSASFFEDYSFSNALTFIVDYHLVKEYYDYYKTDPGFYIDIENVSAMIRSSMKKKKEHAMALREAAAIIKNSKGELNNKFLKDIFTGLGISK